MAKLSLNEESIDKYFNFLKNLDTESKKQLIIKLIASIESKKSKEANISSLYGAWEDDKSAEDIIKDIRASRVQSRVIEDFQ